jgi:chromosomal replication initiator protein
MRPEQFLTWFSGFTLGQISDQEVEFRVPSGFVRDWLNRNYLEQIQGATHAVLKDTGKPVRQVRIGMDTSLAVEERATICAGSSELVRSPEAAVGAVIGEAVGGFSAGDIADQTRDQEGSVQSVVPGVLSGVMAEEASPTFSGVVSQVTGSASVQESRRMLAESPLNKDYTFDQFVVGASNQLSHAAALAVGQNPGRAYNPLFIHGNVGLGKTHLLQSISHAIRKRGRLSRVVYLSCEEFTNRFILAIQTRKLPEFRQHYRAADALVIDDVQFLMGKDKTQEEFFHMFNDLYNSQKQIVFSSDRSPVDLPTVQERLVSRFKWGLVTDVQQPSFETRLAIVRRKALMRKVDLADDVASFIAERITTNIREIEGAVIKVLGVAAITERKISLGLAEEALQGVASSRSNQISIPDVISMITSEFSVTARDLTGKSRTQKVSLPRQIGMFLSREYTDHSLEEVGRYFGNRDHTTVLYAVTKIKKRSKSDRMFRELLTKLSSRLESGGFQRPI